MEEGLGSVVVQLGVGGIFAILILQLVLGFLEKWRARQETAEGGSRTAPTDDVDMRLVAKRVDDLWEWHNVRNSDGVFVWYVRTALEDAIVQLADNIAAQTEVMRDMGLQLRDSCQRIERMERSAEKERGK